MAISARANTRLDEPTWFDVEREPVEFGRRVVPPADKGEIFLFVDQEDIGTLFVLDDAAAVALRRDEWAVDVRMIDSAYLDIPGDLTPSLRHASMKAELDWGAVIDEQRVVVASDGGRSVGHVDGE